MSVIEEIEDSADLTELIALANRPAPGELTTDLRAFVKAPIADVAYVVFEHAEPEPVEPVREPGYVGRHRKGHAVEAEVADEPEPEVFTIAKAFSVGEPEFGERGFFSLGERRTLLAYAGFFTALLLFLVGLMWGLF